MCAGLPHVVQHLRRQAVRVEMVVFEDRNEIEWTDYDLVHFLPTFNYFSDVPATLEVSFIQNILRCFMLLFLVSKQNECNQRPTDQ